MNALRVALGILAVVILAGPELQRYSAERELNRLDGVLQLEASSNSAADQRPIVLARLARDLQRVRSYPGDYRPFMLAASAQFVAGDYSAAANLFAIASLNGERPELDMNQGLALSAEGDAARAEDDFVRAVWLSPSLLERAGSLRQPVQLRIHALVMKMRSGALRSADLPPSPESSMTQQR